MRGLDDFNAAAIAPAPIRNRNCSSYGSLPDPLKFCSHDSRGLPCTNNDNGHVFPFGKVPQERLGGVRGIHGSTEHFLKYQKIIIHFHAIVSLGTTTQSNSKPVKNPHKLGPS